MDWSVSPGIPESPIKKSFGRKCHNIGVEGQVVPPFYAQFCFCKQSRNKMKKVSILILFIGLFESHFNLFSIVRITQPPDKSLKRLFVRVSEPEQKQAAFKILKAKCNVCHKKKNPFKIFSLRNMDRHAPKIYKQVFVYKRMPKGDQIQLTEQEYKTLKDWLKSKNIFSKKK